MSKHALVLGKVDYNNSGHKNCKAVLTWSLEDGRFSMRGEIWNPRETNCYSCGQNVDTVAAYFPHNALAQRMVQVWLRWHLNDMRAGSPDQMAYVRNAPSIGTYDDISKKLAAVGLNPDPNFIHTGQPYKYGSAWLKEEIPADVVAEIESWSCKP